MAVDLGKLKPVPPEHAAEAMGAAELQWGLRCMGCAERVTEGVRVYLLAPVRTEKGVEVQRIRLTFCLRDACRAARDEARSDGTYEEPFSLRWLDEGGPSA